MKLKRIIRGGRREYRRNGISSLFALLAWYTSVHVAPNLRAFYYTTIYPKDTDHYDVPIDPYNVIWANPDEITYKTNRETSRWASFARNLGSVKGGDWDRNCEAEFSPKHSTFIAHFENGVDWEDTQFYEEAIEAIARGEYTLRMATSKEEVMQRLHEIDELYETIKNEGYKTQEELGTYDTTLQQLGNEIQVDIGRDGTLLFVEGRHRLSIAKILNIEVVPVIVVCRHEEWVEKLEECYRRGEPIDHPDWENIRT